MLADIDQALGEYYRRVDRGERVDRAQFLAEFPHLADELEECLVTADSVELFGMVQAVAEDSAFGSRSGSALPGETIDSAVEIPSPEEFLQRVSASKLVPAKKLSKFVEQSCDEAGELPDSSTLGLRLVEFSLLTTWQCRQLLAGKPLAMGNYQLVDYLGHGGMSHVYLAEHTRMQRQVALKLLPKRLCRNSTYLERFLREARAIARLDHPHIVRAFDVDNDGPQYYIVMEYVEGRDLRQIVKDEGPLDAEKAAECIRQAAYGLAHAHAEGMIHRDVKPANVLVSDDGIVKLLDLGLALPADEEQQLTIEHNDAVLGTVDYMAPEQAMDSHNVDERSDLYSLGCTLYFLLSGGPPYPDGTVAQKLMYHQQSQPAPLETMRADVPLGLIEICQRLMAPQPEDRFASAEELIDAIEFWQASLATQVDEEEDTDWDAVEELHEPRQPPWMQAAAGIILFAALAYGAYSLLDRPSTVVETPEVNFEDMREDPFATDMVWEPQPDNRARNRARKKPPSKPVFRVLHAAHEPILEDNPLSVNSWHGPGAPRFDTGRKLVGRGCFRFTANWAAAPNIKAVIREKPKTGEYRYLRFAWKKTAGQGVGMLIAMREPDPKKKQPHIEKRWEYRAGHFDKKRNIDGKVFVLEKELPKDWVVVTRDLYADCGPIRIFAFRVGVAASDKNPLFVDHFHLGRRLSDLPPLPAGVLHLDGTQTPAKQEKKAEQVAKKQASKQDNSAAGAQAKKQANKADKQAATAKKQK